MPNQLLEKYQQYLTRQRTSPATIERHLSSIRAYFEFLKTSGLLEKTPLAPYFPKETPKPSPQLEEKIIQEKLAQLGVLPKTKSSFFSQLLLPRLVKKFFQKTSRFFKSVPHWRYNLPYYLKYHQPRWYVKYKKLSFSRYLNFALLTIVCIALGIGAYEKFLKKTQEGKVLGTVPSLPPKYLSFQGRLTDTSGTPINQPAHFRFAIYNDSTASGSAKLYEEAKWIRPDQDGIFNTLIGDTTTIDPTIFKENTELWLGVTVNTNEEMTDRQPIATVAYAFNSQYLQGYGVGSTGANINEIPVIDSQGKLIIAASGPTLQTTTGVFKIESPTLALMTNGSSGNIGIGFSNPGSKLTISGNLAIGTTNPSSAYLTAVAPHGGAIIEGNVGIGTTNPLEKLDISGNATISGNLTFSGARTIASRAFNQLTIGDSATGDILFSPGTGKQVRFYSSSNYIDSSGNMVLAGSLSVGTSANIGSS